MNYWRKVISESEEAKNCWNKCAITSDDTYVFSNDYVIPEKLFNRILDISNGQDIIIYLIFISSIAIMYKKYSNSDKKFILGCHPININKQMAKILPLVGDITDDETISELLNNMKELYIELNNNCNIRTNELSDIIKENFINTKGYINASVIMSNIYNGDSFLCGEELTFTINKQDTIVIKISGKGSKYNKDVLDRLFRHLVEILKTVISKPNVKVKDLNMLGEYEKNKILHDFNETYSNYSNNKTMIDIWSETLNKYSNKCAVIYKDKEITYKELDEKSNTIAYFLIDKGIIRNNVVGLMVNRSFEMLIGILGIIKAGGTYMPILPSYPKDRIKYMIEDSNTSIVLSTNEFIDYIPDLVKRIDINEIPQNSKKIVKTINNPNDYLYIIYTSGSTGNPKGVLTNHTAFINRIEWMINKLNISEDDIILQKTSFCFDVSVWELLLPSFIGAKVCMLEQGDEMNPSRIIDIINKNKISIIHFVPSMFIEYIQWLSENDNKMSEMKSIKYIICSGESLKASSVNDFYNIASNKELNISIINLYGPTEAAIDVTYYTCDRQMHYTFIPIGKPINNVKTLVLNEDLNLVPIGVQGELCISGVAVSDGYINKSKLTKDKFVDCAYTQDKIYKTGDLVRLLDDGNIEYISRIDNQVKLRGFRIELGEIETRLLKYDKIKQAVVLVNKDNLCAYFVSTETIPLTKIKKFLSKKLPPYMIPNYFIGVNKMPITTNGKLDTNKLLSMNLSNILENEYINPKNEIEEKVVEIYKDILNIENVGVNDSFFDLGGHSLKISPLISKIYDEFNITISIEDVFKYETPKELSKNIIKDKPIYRVLYEEIPKLEKQEYYETSSAQKRIYTIQKADPNNTSYNIPISIILEGDITLNKVHDIFNTLIARHESFRTTFKIINGEIKQHICSKLLLHIEELDLKYVSYSKEFSRFIRPFDLENGPLIRVSIGIIDISHKILFIDMHHIISDGISINILIDEFKKLLNNEKLSLLNTTYKDYSKWSNDNKNSKLIANEKGYWLNKFNDEIPVLNTFTDNDRLSINNNNGKVKKYKLGLELTNEIHKLCNDYSTTEYVVLISILFILLSKYSNQNDIIIGSPISGRRNSSVRNIIGMFVNTIAIRSKIDRNYSYNNFLLTLKEDIIKDLDNQDYDFDELVSSLDLRPLEGRNPLFDIMFSTQKSYEDKLLTKNLKLTLQDRIESMTKFDLNITAILSKKDIELEIEFKSELYHEETIDTLCDNYKKIIESISKNHNILIDNIQCMNEKETISNNSINYFNKYYINNNDNKISFREYTISSELFNKILGISNSDYINVYLLFLCSIGIMYEKYSINESIDLNCYSIDVNNNMHKLRHFTVKIFKEKSFLYNLKNVKSQYFDFCNNYDMNKSYCFSFNKELLFTIDINNTINIKIEGRGSNYSKEILDRIYMHLVNIIKAVINEPNIKISSINMLGKEEENKIVYDYNNTYSKYSDDKTFIDIWEDTIRNHSDECAIIYKDKMITYKELDERSNEISAFLRSKGVTRNTIVGLMVNRSFEMLVGILSVVKAGGAYMPILPSYPSDRIKYMLQDSKTTMVLSTKDFIKTIPEGVESININEITSENKKPLEKINKPLDYLYIIYTSGSTGNPKGVLTKHTACINRIEWMINKLNITKNDTILQKTSFCFDVSVWELLLPSFLGAKVCMLEQGDEMNPEKVLDSISNNKVSIIHFVPSMLNIFIEWLNRNQNRIDEMNSIRYVICSGEALEAISVNHFYSLVSQKSLRCNIINLYGPTEAAIDVSYFDCDKNINYSFIPIGKSISNVKLLVLDDKLKPVATSVPGELCIGGIAVSDGYLNKENLTKEKFVDSNYVSGKIYKTGDLVRLLDDGNIEYITRMDNQVKIRGFRIELGEIETRLLQFSKISQAAVLVNNDNICAYIVCTSPIIISDIKAFLGENLPYYMIPNYFIEIDELPITSNGKLDRKNLLSMKLSNRCVNEFANYENGTEKKLVNIYKDTLKIEKVGVNDSFFDLGGHSLKAAILVSKIYDEFKVTISMKDVFKYETVRELSKKILAIKPSSNILFEEIPIVEKQGYYETSSAQKRIYTLQKFDEDSIAYNIPVSFILEGDLNINKVKAIFNKLIERHESLRTNFRMINGANIVQIINDNYKFDIDLLDTTEENYKQKYYEFIRPFDLENGPLIRVAIGKISTNKSIMFIDMHHIISDGVSINILIKEFLMLYEGTNLLKLPITYKDYSKWSNKTKNNGIIKVQENYWINKFRGNIPILNLPTDYKRHQNQSHIGKIIKYKLGREESNKLGILCKEKAVTEYILLMSILNILFSKYSGEDDIIIGTPIATRRNVNLQNIVGLFVNTLAIRTKINGNLSFNDFLAYMKKNILEDFENQDYQFNDLVNKLNIHSEYNRNPLFDVIFSLDNWHEMNFQIPGLKVSQKNINESMVKFDLNITAMRNEDNIEFNIEYSTELFKEETINRMFDHFKIIIDQILNNQDILIKNIQCMTNKERKLAINYNNTNKEITYLPIIPYIKDSVIKYSKETAIIENNKEITYYELWNLAHKISSYLLLNGVKPGDFVAVIGNNSMEAIACFIGILKIEASFIPIDKEWPLDRCKYVIDKNECTVTLNTNTIRKNVENIDTKDLSNIAYDINDNMYSIYTSGSTGKPKGVVVTQKSVINTILDINDKFNITTKDTFMTLSSIAFDLSIYDIFSSLILGSKIVIIDDIKDIRKIKDVVINNKITIWNSVPEIMKVFVDNVKEKIGTLRVVMLSGDKIPTSLPKKINEIFYNSELISLGGATEGAIWSIYYPIKNLDSKIDRIPYGKPLANQQIYILDKWNKQCPIGTPGEICIGGCGVAKGYYKDKKKTVEKFIMNEDYGYIYKTGDLGILNRNNYVEIIGRNDRQVKVNGYRVELGEIEASLTSMPEINEAIAFLSNKDNCIYTCITINSEILGKDIFIYINKTLPKYMIPKKINILDKIPYTFNGKVDINKIQTLFTTNNKNNYVSPNGEKEILITEIFKRVLEQDKISVIDSFFDLGGNSLQAMSIIYQINDTLGCDLPIKALYENSSIRVLAEKVEINKDINGNTTYSKIIKSGTFEATSMQRYFYKDYKKNPIINNAAMYIKLNSTITRSEIEAIIDKLVLKHEALRTNFYEKDQHLFQIVHVNQKVKVNDVGLIDESIEDYYKKIRSPFNLNEDSILRIYLGKSNSNEQIILIEYHEIIADGIAISILMDEFMKMYQGISINTMQYSYIEYCEKNNELRHSDIFQNEKNYWLNKFKSLDKLKIKKEQRGKAAVKNFIINQDLVKQVKSCVTKYKSTEYTVYLSIINLLMKYYYNIDEIIIGSPIAGRRRREEKELIGVLTNIIPIYTKFYEKMNYEEYLMELTINVLNDFENQDILIYELFDFLSDKFNTKVEKLFDIMFSLTDNSEINEENDDVLVNSIILDDSANNLLHFAIEKCIDNTYMSIKYDSGTFLEKDIDLLFNKFIDIINTLLIEK